MKGNDVFGIRHDTGGYALDASTLMIPLAWFPRLQDASPADRTNWRLIGQGVGIRWDAIDEDISVRGLLMPTVEHHRTATHPGS